MNPIESKNTINKQLIWLGFALIPLLLALFKVLLAPYFFTWEQPHYISVSWQLWQSHQWIVLHDDSGLYLNKPPLLFWLVNSVWHLFGINNWIFSFLPASIFAANLFLVSYLFKCVSPKDHGYHWIAGALFFGSLYYSSFLFKFQFDLLVVFFTLIANISLIKTFQGKNYYWILFGIANGLGILNKGPFILIFTFIPMVVLFFLGIEKKKIYLLGLLSSIVISLAILSLWLIPLAQQIGYEHLKTLVFNKAFGVHNYSRRSHIWHYVITLSMIAFPWNIWPYAWRSLWQQLKNLNCFAVKYSLFSFVAIFIVMTLLPIKASRYFLPEFVFLALFLARAFINGKDTLTNYTFKPYLWLSTISAIVLLASIPFASFISAKFNIPQLRWYQLLISALLLAIPSIIIFKQKRLSLSMALFYQMTLSVAFLFLALFCFGIISSQQHNTSKLANYLLKANKPIAYVFHYRGYLYHVGKNQMPPGTIILANQKQAWAMKNPQGLIVSVLKINSKPTKAIFSIDFGSHRKIVVLSSRQFLPRY